MATTNVFGIEGYSARQVLAMFAKLLLEMSDAKSKNPTIESTSSQPYKTMTPNNWKTAEPRGRLVPVSATALHTNLQRAHPTSQGFVSLPELRLDSRRRRAEPRAGPALLY